MLLLVAALAAGPNSDFARCLAAMREMKAYAVRAEFHSTSMVLTTSAVGTLRVRSRSWADLSLSTPPEAGHGAIDWRYEVRGRKLLGYDANRRSYLVLTYGKALAALPTLADQLGSLIPDPIQKVMTPDALAGFLSKFRNLKGWVRTTVGDTTLWKDATPKGAVTFGFSRTSGRLTNWQIVGSGATISWKLSYPPLSKMRPLAIPGDAVLVEAFRMPPMWPIYHDRATQAVLNSCFNAYESLFKVGVTMTENGIATRIWRNGGTVEQIGPSGGWRWSQGTLTVWPKSQPVSSGHIKLQELTSYLAQLRVEATPLALAFARDENYAANLITPDYGAKAAGEVVLGGVSEHIIQLFGPAVRVDLGIDAKGLIRRIDSTAYDSTGHALTETIRQFTYASGAVIPGMPVGKPRPLPRLGRVP